MTSALEYVILGQEADARGDRQRKMLLFNGRLPAHYPDYFVELVDLAPMPDEGGRDRPALFLADYDGERNLLAIIQPNEDRRRAFTEHFVFFPIDGLAESARQIEKWLVFLPQVSHDINMTLPLLQPPAFSPLGLDARSDNLERLFAELPEDSFEHALTLLGAALDARPLFIRNFPAEFSRRLGLVAGLQALLPGKPAGQLTFATQAPHSCQRLPQLVFGDAPAEVDAWSYDWGEPQLIAEAQDHDYLRALRAMWRCDVSALAAEMQNLAAQRQAKSPPASLSTALQQMADRALIDRQVQEGADIPADVLIRILESDSPPSESLRHQYVGKLLQSALNNRDAAAGNYVAEALDRDASLEGSLSGMIDQMLEEQPDAVYVFIRNRLIQLGVSERWLPRLQTAARNSLEVAIEDGDVGTVAGWLELIAHEPKSYALRDVLRGGILAAAKRAWDDGELGIHLILIAVRRLPDIVDRLYADTRLIAALETDVRRALQHPSAATLAPLANAKPEYFLLALYHGIQVTEAQLVTADSVRRLLALYESEERVNLPAAYRAPAIIRMLATKSSHQMAEEAIDLLFSHIVKGDDRALIAEAAHQLADRDMLFPRLGAALEQDTVPIAKALSVMNAVSGIATAAPSDVIDTYFHLLDYYQWEPPTQRMMEALARTLAKHQDVKASYRHLWKLFGSCQALQIEGATRIAVLQLLCQFGDEEDLDIVVEGVAQICGDAHLSKTLCEVVNTWWRDYAHSCSLGQLLRLERELDKYRHLETQKQILKTAVAMRRWMHNRDPAQFAEAIDFAFTFIENITEAFDDARLSEIDGRTVRREVDALSQDLSSEQRHILANNLRNLAYRITVMAEKRSKPSLIRSDDSIEQQLMHGEANPHGSIDMMKWIAGYLDGAHPQRED